MFAVDAFSDGAVTRRCTRAAIGRNLRAIVRGRRRGGLVVVLESAVNRRLVAIVVCLVAMVSYGAVLVNAQLYQHDAGGITGSAYSTTWSLYGWPAVYCERSTTISLPRLRVVETADSLSLAHLSVNAVVVLALSSAVGAVMWRLIQFCGRRRQVSIAFLFGLMTSVGAVFPLDGALDGLAGLPWNKSEWPSPIEATWPLRVAAWFGLFCFAHTATATVWYYARSCFMIGVHDEPDQSSGNQAAR